MEKQTAVEYFYQRILAKDIESVFEQAKEMEKQQIINALKRGSINEHEDLFESVMILYNDCVRMRGNAITQKEANIIIENKYDAGFFAGVEKTYQNTERLLYDIINDYNFRLFIKRT